MKNDSNNKCPICENEVCVNAVLDIHACMQCGHMFKEKNINFPEVKKEQLHKYSEIVKELQHISDNMDKHETIMFEFPSTLFFSFEMNNSFFCTHRCNHYFTQLSLMKLLERAGFGPLKQMNYIDKYPITKILCIKE